VTKSRLRRKGAIGGKELKVGMQGRALYDCLSVFTYNNK
jgi:hypothetical protein